MATITGTSASETLIGTAGVDVISGLDGNDQLRGGDGNDTLIGGAGADFLRGELGVDTVSYAGSSAAVQVDATALVGTGGDAEGDTYGSNEIYIGSIYDDTFTGSAVTFNGGLGNDSYIVTAATVIHELSGEGNDTVYVKANYALSDNLETLICIGTGNFVGRGNSGDNTIIGGVGVDILDGKGGADHLVGGDGSDFADYSLGSAVTVNLQTQVGTGDALGDTYDSVENVIGSAGNDFITGDAGDNQLQGGVGNDTLIGGAGADYLRGQTGVDTVIYTDSSAAVQVTVSQTTNFGTGGDAEGDTYGENEIYFGSAYNDTFSGGAAVTFHGGLGDDTYVIFGPTAGVVENSGEGIDTVSASVIGTYTLSANVENLTYTGAGNFLGTGNAENNIIIAQGDKDRLLGMDGDDLLIGGDGADTITGGNGVDTVSYAGSTGVVVNLLTSTAAGGHAQGDVLSGIENLTGSSANDSLTGDNGANTLLGGAGNDNLTGNDGNDFIEGGAGGDTITGGNGFDTLSYASSTEGSVNIDLQTNFISGGDAWGDVITGIERLIGSGFGDTLTAGGAMTLEGGAGDDTYVVNVSGVVVTESANAGVDRVATHFTNYTLEANVEKLIYNGSGFATATLTGNELNNSVQGWMGDDVLSGEDGNDVLTGSSGADTLIGGSGIDTASYTTAEAGVAVSLSTMSGTAGDAAGDVLSSIEALRGSNFADTLTAASASTLTGGSGDDIYIVDGSGIVVIETSTGGTDTVQTSLLNYTLDAFVENLTYTGAGNATLMGSSAANILTGGTGDDVLIGGAGGDTLAGGAGTDTVSYATAASGVSINLTTLATNGGDASGDVLSSIEAVVGTAFTDILTASSAATLVGGAGHDIYHVNGLGIVLIEQSGGGTDTVETSLNTYTLGANIENLTFTGSGDATLSGNDLANTITGGTGADLLTGATNDTLVGGAGNDTFVVTGTGVVLTETSGNGIDTVQTSLNAYVLGNNIENLTYTGADDATLTGNSLANTIQGGVGDDTISGAGGADTLLGSAGGDTLTGGTGADRFILTSAAESNSVDGVDRITDFSQADGDQIDLSGIGGLTFVGTDAFSGVAGELRYETVGGDTFVFADIDGDTTADLEIRLTGTLTLTSSDFLV